MSGIFTKVLSLPSQFPLLRGMVSYALIWPTCSMVQEYLEHGTRIENADFARAARFGIFGAFFMAPVYYSWMKYTSRFFKGASLKTAITRAAIEQVAYSPLALSYFYFGMSLLERKPLKSCVNEVREKFWPTYKIGVVYWPTAQTLNFYFISEKNRMVFVSAASFIWTVYLAHMKAKTQDGQSLGISKVSADSFIQQTGLSSSLNKSTVNETGLLNTKALSKVNETIISNVSTDVIAKEEKIAKAATDSNVKETKTSITAGPITQSKPPKLSTWKLKDGKIMNIVIDPTLDESKLTNVAAEPNLTEAVYPTVIEAKLINVDDSKREETNQSIKLTDNLNTDKQTNLSNATNAADKETKLTNTSSDVIVKANLATIPESIITEGKATDFTIDTVDIESKLAESETKSAGSKIKVSNLTNIPVGIKLNETELSKASGDFKEDSFSGGVPDPNEEGDLNPFDMQPDLGESEKEEVQESPCFQDKPCIQT